MKTIDIIFKKNHPKAIIPTKGTPDSAGYDLYSCSYYRIKPFEVVMIDTGLSMQLPKGYFARISPRSGLAVKSKIDVFAGIVDRDFPLNWQVVLANFNVLSWLAFVINKIAGLDVPGQFEIKPGDRIGQMVIHEQIDANFIEGELEQTERTGGIGSTGT